MIHLITGGSASGKSEYAERWLLEHAHGKEGLLYIATMVPYGEEARKRILRHQRLRAGRGFLTLERYKDVESLTIPDNNGILLECISNLVSNEFFEADGREKSKGRTLKKLLDAAVYLASCTQRLVIVTGEVCSDINGYSASTESYRELIGMVNQGLAGLADIVTEVVYGIPVVIKDDKNKRENNVE